MKMSLWSWHQLLKRCPQRWKRQRRPKKIQSTIIKATKVKTLNSKSMKWTWWHWKAQSRLSHSVKSKSHRFPSKPLSQKVLVDHLLRKNLQLYTLILCLAMVETRRVRIDLVANLLQGSQTQGGLWLTSGFSKCSKRETLRGLSILVAPKTKTRTVLQFLPCVSRTNSKISMMRNPFRGIFARSWDLLTRSTCWIRVTASFITLQVITWLTFWWPRAAAPCSE